MEKHCLREVIVLEKITP